MTDTRTLPAELTIYAVGEWHERCVGWLDEADPHGDALRLAASAVAEVDAAGVQLLCALANALARRGRRLVLDAPSDALVGACTCLGAGFLLNDTPTLEAAA